MICGIIRAVVHLHIGEGEFLGHFDESDGVYKRRVCVAVWETLLDGCWNPWDFLDECLHLGAKRLATACSMESLMLDRLDPIVEWTGAGVVWEG